MKAFLQPCDTKEFNYYKLLEREAYALEVHYTMANRADSLKDCFLYYKTPLGNEPFADLKISESAARTDEGYIIAGEGDFWLLSPQKLPRMTREKQIVDYFKSILVNRPELINPLMRYDFSTKNEPPIRSKKSVQDIDRDR